MLSQSGRTLADSKCEAEAILLRGVRVHNLRGIDVEIPRGKLTVISGVSGAGKSSLAFDTLYAEAQRRYLQSFSPYTRQFLERFDQPDADYIGNLPPAIAVAGRSQSASPRSTVGTLTEIFDYLGLLLARCGSVRCIRCGQPVQAHQAGDVVKFIETLPAGTRLTVAFPLDVEPDGDAETCLAGLKEEGFVRVRIGPATHRLDEGLPDWPAGMQAWVLVDRVEAGKAALQRLTDSIETAFARGRGRCTLLLDNGEQDFDNRWRCSRCDIEYPPPEPRLLHFNDPRGACPLCQGTGLQPKKSTPCTECAGSRLSELAGYVTLDGRTLADLSAITLAQLARFFDELMLPEATAAQGQLLADTLRDRLQRLGRLELGYLTLQRSAATLSTGEARRLRLCSALGSNLVHALYVVDEPAGGLHPRDVDKVATELLRLCDQGNTVVVVEHEAAFLRAADHIIDLGPGAGEEGGEVVFQGPVAGLTKCENSVTADFLLGNQSIDIPARRPCNHGMLRLEGASIHNLDNLAVEFPLGVLCAVTGVSGAGKSSLVEQSLYPALLQEKSSKKKEAASTTARVKGAGEIGDVVLMDQQPISRSARSNAATYLKVFDEIRKVFADTTDAKLRNFGPGHFSFNQPGGRCETCQGQGTLEVDMQFLADVSITCPECQGTRFRREILGVKVRNLNIAEVLNLTVREAFRFFRAQPVIERRLKFLLDVGLDYLRLGQSTETLSGGECQRLKLAGHLATQRKSRCLFLLLEPTTGLHPADVVLLLNCLDHLLETGHSVIVVEHDLDVIKSADHIIDLGPGAGADGGRIVGTGTPEELARNPQSATGNCLAKLLAGNHNE